MRRALRKPVAHVLGAIAAIPLPLRVVLFLSAVLHGVGLSWGMPASDGWDVDGIAPRDFLPGLAATYAPGSFYTYPPLHLALLALLTLPVTLVAVARAPAGTVSSVVQEILAPPYMTAMAMTARVLALVMSVVIVHTLAKIAEEVAPPDRKTVTGACVALVAALDVPLTYYAHVTNLDVPYLFWALLSVLALTRAITRHEPRRLRRAALFAACAVATKDQSYAMFLLAYPAAVGAWIASDAWARRNAPAVAREVLVAAGLALALVLVVDGGLANPSGFRARLAFLSGAASQDYATYSRDAAGRLAVLFDTARAWDRHYPPLLAAVAALGLLVAAGARGRMRAAAFLPLLVAVSFTLSFNVVARRVEERFTLPQMTLAAVYAGHGLALGWGRARLLSWAVRGLGAVSVASALWQNVVLLATLLHDPRYAAEAWLREHVASGDAIEVHGLNVYLPRFPSGATVTRVGPTPKDRRNPMPGVREATAPLSRVQDRGPRFVVANECYVWRYLERDPRRPEGHIVPQTQRRDAEDSEATALFQGLFHQRLGYRLVYESRITSELLPRREMHASLGCPIFVFERAPSP